MQCTRALVLAILAAPLFAQDLTGPAILTRGEAPSALRDSQVSFRPFLTVTGVYDTGLANVGLNSAGELGNVAAPGVEVSGGVSGAHRWRHTTLGIDYRGSIDRYTKQTYYDSTDQSLLLGLTHQISRHTSFTLRENVGMFSRNFGLLGLAQTVPFDPSTSYVPATDFYDNRTVYVSSQADYTIQKSARLSFNFGGDGFFVRRRSTALYGVTGGGARSDVQYRISRRTTIGAAYFYTHYAYRGAFSSTDMHSAVATYGVRLSKNLEFSAYGGVMRAETKFLQNVPVSPDIAAIIGYPYSTAVRYSIDYVPSLAGRLSRTFQTGIVYVSGGRSVTPGNGLFLTTTMTTASAGYSYTGIRRWSFHTEADYSRGNSIGNVLGTYGDTSGTLAASRQIGKHLSAVATFSARKYQSPSFSLYNRLIYRATLGIGFTPADVPLRLW